MHTAMSGGGGGGGEAIKSGSTGGIGGGGGANGGVQSRSTSEHDSGQLYTSDAVLIPGQPARQGCEAQSAHVPVAPHQIPIDTLACSWRGLAPRARDSHCVTCS